MRRILEDETTQQAIAHQVLRLLPPLSEFNGGDAALHAYPGNHADGNGDHGHGDGDDQGTAGGDGDGVDDGGHPVGEDEDGADDDATDWPAAPQDFLAGIDWQSVVAGAIGGLASSTGAGTMRCCSCRSPPRAQRAPQAGMRRHGGTLGVC